MATERPWVIHKDPFDGEIHYEPGLLPSEQALMEEAYRSYNAEILAIDAKREALTQESYAAGARLYKRTYEIYRDAGLEPPVLYA